MMPPYQNIATVSHHVKPFFRNGITYVMQTSPARPSQIHYKDMIRTIINNMQPFLNMKYNTITIMKDLLTSLVGCHFPSFCLCQGGGGGGISTTLGDEAVATSSLLHKGKTLGHHITDGTHQILLQLLINKAFSFFSPANHNWVILSANTQQKHINT